MITRKIIRNYFVVVYQSKKYWTVIQKLDKKLDNKLDNNTQDAQILTVLEKEKETTIKFSKGTVKVY